MHAIRRRLIPPLLGAFLFTLTTGCSQERAAGERAGDGGPSAAGQKNPGAVKTKESATDPSSEVALRVVKYPELTDTIKQLKGKLVVVDFWSTT